MSWFCIKSVQLMILKRYLTDLVHWRFRMLESEGNSFAHEKRTVCLFCQVSFLYHKLHRFYAKSAHQLLRSFAATHITTCEIRMIQKEFLIYVYIYTNYHVHTWKYEPLTITSFPFSMSICCAYWWPGGLYVMVRAHLMVKSNSQTDSIHISQ